MDDPVYKGTDMSRQNVRSYYVAALHALRSASEQGAASAPKLEESAANADLKAIVADYGQLASIHRDKIVSFLGELEERPNDFKDRVMEGVGNGTDEMLSAASDDVIDLGVISGSRTGAQYYRNAFEAQPATAKALGYDDQAARWGEMAAEWKEIEDRLAAASRTALKTSLGTETQAA
ncbi:DUF892 family protein [Sphingomonas sp. CLY1604]|uniref:DUF892 family protein n=1 Tax=Sphingomonas sp. CLY1604 TaxID=3457786 RepID=UPI003FD7D996